MIRRVRAIAGLLACWAGAASAGVYIETEERDVKTGRAGATQKIYLQAEKARFEAPGETIAILQADTLSVLDPAEKSYVVLDRAAMERMGSQVNGAMALANATLAKLPPEQRAMLEQMLKEQIPGAPVGKPVEMKVVDTGRSETVDGRSCRVWEVRLDGVLDQQHCVVPFDSLPGDEDVRGAFERMGRFFESMQAALPAYAAAAATEFDSLARLGGFPVLTRDFERGKPTGNETRVETWREESVPASMFEVPPGYRKRDLAAEPDPGR